jgi:hypothetical protein
MFVVSMSSSNLKKLFGVVFALALVSLVAVFFVNSQSNVNIKKVSLYTAETADDRLKFISDLGWIVDEEPVEVRQIAIPQEFDDVYSNYNEIQLSQGYDLTKYAGRSAKRWTYIIRNYPDVSSDEDYVRINLLVCDGKIIGGDVCSIKLDGFMHGFEKDSI